MRVGNIGIISCTAADRTRTLGSQKLFLVLISLGQQRSSPGLNHILTSRRRPQVCQEGYWQAQYGLRGCANLNNVGVYSLKFFVLDSATGESTSVVRTVTVLPLCTATEVRCRDRSCSTGGFCLSGSATAANVSPPPGIELRTLALLEGSVVRVPRGVVYAACEDGQLSTALLPCEPGASPHIRHLSRCHH